MAICRNQDLRGLSQDVSRKWEDLYVLSLIIEPAYRACPTAWASENAECSKRAEGIAPCLQTLYERRKVFVKSERIAQGLDQLPVPARAALAKIRADLPEGDRHFGTNELLTIHPVIAPLGASILGPDWLDWSLSSEGGGWPDPEPGERWIVALGSMAHNVVTSQVYLVVDLAGLKSTSTRAAVSCSGRRRRQCGRQR